MNTVHDDREAGPALEEIQDGRAVAGVADTVRRLNAIELVEARDRFDWLIVKHEACEKR